MEQRQVDRATFATTVAIILLVCLPLALFPKAGGRAILGAYSFISNQLGFLYLAAGVAVLALLAWLAASRYGRVTLGEAGGEPEFGTLSWIGMLFCAGVGGGLMFWAPVEWAYYYTSPPFGIGAGSPDAVRWAAAYGPFHWGVIAWSFYCLPTLAIAYPYYVKKSPYLRFSLACHYFIGSERETRRGRLMDFFFMIALLGGAGSSIGFTIPVIASSLGALTGVPNGFALEVVSLGLCVALFAVSVWLGLRRGIKRLSDINLGMAFALLVFVFVAGPTLFLLNTSFDSLALMLKRFVAMNSWAESTGNTGFSTTWTVWYWAWWIAYGPFVGLFVTRISKGRSIRQVILGMLCFGSLGAMLFYMVIGNYGLSLELNGTLAVTEILRESGQAEAVVAVLQQLPLPGLVLALFCLVTIVFCATTYDSASYILASSATRRLEAGDDPARWHRVFWAFALAVIPLTLMFVGRLTGDPRTGLTVIQTATLVVSLPLLLIGLLMAIALVRQLRADHA
jgi:BCCT family betaine/carnitine transporter